MPGAERYGFLRPDPPPGSVPGLTGAVQLCLSYVRELVPLDTQLGHWPKKSVIDALQPFLFDARGIARGETVHAIIDAAKLDDLPDHLAQSDLRHRCLFKGDALRDWGHVAPWLVTLGPDDRLTRRLFTGGERPFGWWDSGAALFMRGDSDLDALWRHLRKYTRIEDEGGRWAYFRFWEAVAIQMLYRSRALPHARDFFAPCAAWLAPMPKDHACLVIEQRCDPHPAALPVPLRPALPEPEPATEDAR